MDAASRISKQIQTLEDENASLRNLTKSLMRERQELLKKTQASNVEMAKLRRMSGQIQRQLEVTQHRKVVVHASQAGSISGGDRSVWGLHDVGVVGVKGHASINQPGLIWAATGVEAGVGIGGGWQQGGGGGGEHDGGGDLSQLSWMAPEFDLDDLL